MKEHKTAAGTSGVLQGGKVYDLPTARAKGLIKGGYAEAVKDTGRAKASAVSEKEGGKSGDEETNENTKSRDGEKPADSGDSDGAAGGESD